MVDLTMVMTMVDMTKLTMVNLNENNLCSVIGNHGNGHGFTWSTMVNIIMVNHDGWSWLSMANHG